MRARLLLTGETDHERALNFVDQTTASKVLVSSRVRATLVGATGSTKDLAAAVMAAALAAGPLMGIGRLRHAHPLQDVAMYALSAHRGVHKRGVHDAL